MFRTVSLSIIRSLALYTQQLVYVILKFQKWVKFYCIYCKRMAFVLTNYNVYLYYRNNNGSSNEHKTLQ